MVAQRDADGSDAPLFFVRVGSAAFYHKGGRRSTAMTCHAFAPAEFTSIVRMIDRQTGRATNLDFPRLAGRRVAAAGKASGHRGRKTDRAASRRVFWRSITAPTASSRLVAMLTRPALLDNRPTAR